MIVLIVCMLYEYLETFASLQLIHMPVKGAE